MSLERPRHVNVVCVLQRGSQPHAQLLLPIVVISVEHQTVEGEFSNLEPMGPLQVLTRRGETRILVVAEDEIQPRAQLVMSMIRRSVCARLDLVVRRDRAEDVVSGGGALVQGGLWLQSDE